MKRKQITTRFVKAISVTDPDTGSNIELEIHKDPESGALLAIESSFLEQVREDIPSPYNSHSRLVLPEPE